MKYGEFSVILIALILQPNFVQGQGQPTRARDLGVPFEGTPGKFNAITDVDGVLVGHTTLISGDGADAIRTGVTAILPNAQLEPFDAATFVLNGDAELSGAIFAEEFGWLRSPIMLTGTASNGTVYTSVIKWSIGNLKKTIFMPVVTDTYDGYLSNYKLFPVKEEHVFSALDGARSGPVAEGNVGGGTGMFCHDFKCGIGTASRVLAAELGGFTVGVLVQANYGDRGELLVAGVPVGKEVNDWMPEIEEWTLDSGSSPDVGSDGYSGDDGSVVVVIATDAPVTARSLKALARRAALGLARNGATASPYSGDVAIAFTTRKLEWLEGDQARWRAESVDTYELGPLYTATIQATEEAVINSMVAAQTLSGRAGNRVYALPHDRLREVLQRYNRLIETTPK